MPKSNQCSIFSTLGNFWVNKKDLQALSLVGPNKENHVFSTLAVPSLNIWQGMNSGDLKSKQLLLVWYSDGS